MIIFYETSNKKDEELIAHTAFIVGTTSCGKSGAVRQKFLVLSRSGHQLFREKVSQLSGWTEAELYEHWIGMYGVLPPASLQYDGEGKLLAHRPTLSC
eukprot:g9040.t1